MITDIQLQLCMECVPRTATLWAPFICEAMGEFEINTPKRQAAFLAQVGHESGRLVYRREIWGPTQAQRKYEWRSDLGNILPGDGFKFRGRGLIQITGRKNYERCGKALGLDLIEDPDKLAEYGPAARSAGWFWKDHDLNELADDGMFELITRRINGGLNGYAERCHLWNVCKSVLGVDL